MLFRSVMAGIYQVLSVDIVAGALEVITVMEVSEDIMEAITQDL